MLNASWDERLLDAFDRLCQELSEITFYSQTRRCVAPLATVTIVES